MVFPSYYQCQFLHLLILLHLEVGIFLHPVIDKKRFRMGTATKQIRKKVREERRTKVIFLNWLFCSEMKLKPKWVFVDYALCDILHQTPNFLHPFWIASINMHLFMSTWESIINHSCPFFPSEKRTSKEIDVTKYMFLVVAWEL